MSIFSALSPADIRTAVEAAKHSPEALAALGIVALVMVAAVGFAVSMVTRHIGGFAAHIQEEEERMRQEEDAAQAASDGGDAQTDDI